MANNIFLHKTLCNISPITNKNSIKIFIFFIFFIFSFSIPAFSVRLNEYIFVNSLKRTYNIYIPSKYKNNTSVPLLIVLHGGGGSGKNIEEITTMRKFDKIAEKENFIVVYPDAHNKFWNDGKNFWFNQIDDVKFISKLIDKLENQYNIDKNKVFVTGFSNGGMMCFRLACELTEKISGIASVAASMPEKIYKNCKPSKKISVLIIHGIEDKIVPFKGGDIKIFGLKRGKVVSIEKTFKFWQNYNNCKIVDNKNIWQRKCEIKNIKVWLYVIVNGGHTWPGGIRQLPIEIVGNITYKIDACELIWNFFKSLF